MTHENRDAFAAPDGELLSCAACQARLPEYVAGVLATPWQKALARHLVGCAACREEEQQWRTLDSALQHETPAPSSTALAGVVSAAWAGIEASLATQAKASAGTHATPEAMNGWRPRTTVELPFEAVEPMKTNLINESHRAMNESTQRPNEGIRAATAASSKSARKGGSCVWLSGIAAMLILALLVGGVFVALRHLGTNRKSEYQGGGALPGPQHVVVASTVNGAVTAFDPATGAIRWSTQLVHEQNPNPIIILRNIQSGVVIAEDIGAVSDANGSGNINTITTYYALRTQDGSVLWHKKFNGNSVSDMYDGVVYIDGPQGELLAVRATDGKTLWDMPNTNLLTAADSFLYIAHGQGSDTTTIQKLRIDTHAVVWSHKAHVANSILFSELSSSHVYIEAFGVGASPLNEIQELSASTGQALSPFLPLETGGWLDVLDYDVTPPDLHYILSDMSFIKRSKVTSTTRGIVGGVDGPFCAVSLPTDKTLWCDPTRPSTNDIQSSAFAGGKLYLGTDVGFVFHGGATATYTPTIVKLNAASGATIWQWMGPSVTGAEDSPNVAMSPGHVYISTAGGIFAIDAATGRQLWRATPQEQYVTMLAV